MSKEVAPHMVMEFLNELFSKFDDLCDSHNVYKVRSGGHQCAHLALWASLSEGGTALL